MTEPEAKQLIAMLFTAFPTQVSRMATGDAAMSRRVYERGIIDLDVAAGVRAVERLARTAKWLPTIADIRGEVHAAASPRRTGAEAWEDVRKEIGRTGYYREPKFGDPAVAAIVRGLGWRELCLSENPAADRARFIDAYEARAADTRTDEIASKGALPAPRPSDPTKIGDAIKGLLDEGES